MAVASYPGLPMFSALKNVGWPGYEVVWMISCQCNLSEETLIEGKVNSVHTGSISMMWFCHATLKAGIKLLYSIPSKYGLCS